MGLISGQPRYVDLDNFVIGSHETRITALCHAETSIRRICVTLVACFVTIVIAVGARTASQEMFFTSAGLALAGATLLLVLVNRVSDIVSREKSERRHKIQKAKELYKRHLCYDVDIKDFKGFDHIHNWMVRNGVEATVAQYQDRMMGYEGLHISFPDDESFILFKMTFT